MKKIVALVLSLVMALSLCTVAFAADKTYPLFDKDGKEIPDFDVEVELVEAKYDEERTDLGHDSYGNLAYYAGDDDRGYEIVEKKDAEYSINTPAGVVYLALIEDDGWGSVVYNFKGEKAAKVYVWDCEEGLHDEGYKFTDEDGDVVLTKKCDLEDADLCLLVGKEIVPVRYMISVFDLYSDDTQDLTPSDVEWVPGGHVLYQVSKDAVRPNVYSFKCAGCGTEFYGSYLTNFGPDSAVSYSSDYAEALSYAFDLDEYGFKFGWDALQELPKYTKLVDEDLWIWAKNADSAKPADGVESAKTFDAGVAMYVGMSLLSVAGGAVVIGKKKEF